MLSVIVSRLNDLPLEIRHGLGTFRYQVFVQRLGWSLPDTNDDTNAEWDQFDGENTVHVVALTSRQQICGCARLMPTTGPYLLQKLLPESSNIDLPSSPTVWELSRFAGSGIDGRSASAASGMQLFPYALAIAVLLGATRIVGALTRAIARLYRRFGLDLQPIGPTDEASELPFLVCGIDLTPLTFTHLGSDLADLRTSITWLGACTSIAPREISMDRRAPSSLDRAPTYPRILVKPGNPYTVDSLDNSHPIDVITPTRIAVPSPRGDDAGCLRPSPNPA